MLTSYRVLFHQVILVKIIYFSHTWNVQNLFFIYFLYAKYEFIAIGHIAQDEDNCLLSSYMENIP